MFLLFGDTYGSDRKDTELGEDTTSRNWLSNFMAITSDTDLNDGLEFDDLYRKGGTYPQDKACAIIEGKHEDLTNCINKGWERTKINQGGIEAPDGTLYSFYESVRNFGANGTWMVNYQGAIKSTDGGVTWERVHDLTWFVDVDNHFDYAVKSAEETVAEAARSSELTEAAEIKGLIKNAEEREAPYFAQCYPLDGKDGYMYLFGRARGRQHGIKVARVLWDNIENFEEYEYYQGMNADGTPKFIKGYDGMKALNNDEVGYVFAHGQDEVTSSFSACYNEYLGKWMICYYQPPYFAEGNNVKMSPEKVGFRLSDTVWGNYGRFHTIMEQDFFAPNGVDTPSDILEFNGYNADASWKTNKIIKLYGGFVNEKYQEQNGKIFYMIMTLSGPYNSALFRITLN